jgi:hypothetical protein
MGRKVRNEAAQPSFAAVTLPCAPLLRRPPVQIQILKDAPLGREHIRRRVPVGVAFDVDPLAAVLAHAHAAAVEFESLRLLTVPSKVPLERVAAGPADDRTACRSPRAYYSWVC